MKFSLLISLMVLSVHLFGQEKRTIKPPAFSIPLKAATINPLKGPDTLKIHEEYNFMPLGLKDGLSSRFVRKVWLDSRDFVWIATNGGGISIYDGQKFRYLNTSNGLSSDIVHDFEEADDGRIWIATNKGISIFDGKNWEYRTAARGNFGAEPVWSLLKDKDGRMFMGTAGGGFSIYYEKEAEHHIDINGDSTFQIYDMVEDSKTGQVWLGTHAKGVLEYQDGKVKQHLFGDGISEPQNIIMGVEVVRQGNKTFVYAGSADGLWIYDGSDWTRYSTDDGLTNNWVLSVKQDSKGNVWVGTNDGMVKWNQNDLKTYNIEEGLNGPRVQSFFEDDWGNLWIALRDNGITKYQGDKFVHFTEQGGLPDQVNCIYKDSKGNVWLGLFSDGAVKYDGSSFTHYGIEQGFPANHMITDIEEDDEGNLWFGMLAEMVVKFDGDKFYHYSGAHNRTRNTDFNQRVHTLEYAQGELWAGTRHSPVRITEDSIHFYGHQQNIIDHYWFLDSYVDRDGTVWFGTYGGGAAKLDYDKRETTILTTRVGLVTNAISGIDQDNYGNYWFCGEGENIRVLKADAFSKPAEEWEWIELGREQGLPTKDLVRTFTQKDGDVWISSARGMCKVVLNGEDIFDGNYRIKLYSFNEGFRGVESNREGVEAPDGRLWFYSNGSISVLDPRLDIHSTLPPTPALSNIKIELKEVDWREHEGAKFSALDNWTGLPQNLSLPYRSNHVSFEFNGISHANPKGVEFSWKLNGFDEDFSPWTKRTNATYSNLSWGEFTFELRCRDQFGNISESISFPITIRKAYYHTWVFRIVVLIAVFFLLYGIFRWRTAALKNRQKVLEQTVEERTVEIKKAKEEIEHQQEEILDSISYAKRIQEAILPPDESVQKIVPNSFVLYVPKDIVAGDFYWIETIGNYKFIAAADCTGHGVPGAMVSVVCSNALNHAVLNEGITDPSKILDRVTDLVVERFKKGNEQVKDGMDIALCRLDTDSNEVVFAGAHNPLWIVRQGSQEIEEHKSTKQPVGEFHGRIPFEETKLTVASGDRLYIFSDGYADQFGGPKGKKLKTANFKKLILEAQSKSFGEHGSYLFSMFEEWKGELEQLDDVCVIGFEI